MPVLAQASDYLTLYGGAFDIFDNNKNVQLGAEYRYDDIYYGLRPTAGITVDHEGALYGYGGIYWDVPVANRFYLTPNAVVGLYKQGAGKNLGGAVEFRTGVEVSYEMESKARVGVAFNHISNASIYDHNPGAESLLFVYQHPLD